MRLTIRPLALLAAFVLTALLLWSAQEFPLILSTWFKQLSPDTQHELVLASKILAPVSAPVVLALAAVLRWWKSRRGQELNLEPGD